MIWAQALFLLIHPREGWETGHALVTSPNLGPWAYTEPLQQACHPPSHSLSANRNRRGAGRAGRGRGAGTGAAAWWFWLLGPSSLR